MSMLERKIREFAIKDIALSEMTKSIFRTYTPSEWTLPKKQTKAKPKKEEEEKQDKHSSNMIAPNAVLTKHGYDYAANFGGYIRTDVSRAKVYNTISPNIAYLYGVDAPKLVELFEACFKLGSADCNFNPKATRGVSKAKRTANQSIPYSWQAHHLIPGEAFTLMKNNRGGTEEIFTPTQYALLLISKYDINHGHNLIALPGGGYGFFPTRSQLNPSP